MCWSRWLCSLTRVRRRPVILPASSCRMCCWACAVLAGRILPGRSDVRYQHVDSGMAQLQPDDGTCFQIQAFIDCSATAHYWCGVLGDLLIPLTGISCPQIMESPCFGWPVAIDCKHDCATVCSYADRVSNSGFYLALTRLFSGVPSPGGIQGSSDRFVCPARLKHTSGTAVKEHCRESLRCFRFPSPCRPWYRWGISATSPVNKRCGGRISCAKTLFPFCRASLSHRGALW